MKSLIYRTCAVCGKTITNSYLCSECYKQWGNEAEWVKFLIRYENTAFMRNYRHPETLFCEVENIEDLIVEKIF